MESYAAQKIAYEFVPDGATNDASRHRLKAFMDAMVLTLPEIEFSEALDTDTDAPRVAALSTDALWLIEVDSENPFILRFGVHQFSRLSARMEFEVVVNNPIQYVRRWTFSTCPEFGGKPVLEIRSAQVVSYGDLEFDKLSEFAIELAKKIGWPAQPQKIE